MGGKSLLKAAYASCYLDVTESYRYQKLMKE